MDVRLVSKKHFWILVSLLFLHLPTSFATDYISPSNWYVSGGIGFLIPSLSSHSTTVFNGSTTQNPNDLYSISKPGVAPTLALEGGYRWTRINDWFHTVTVGLRYQYLTSFTANGSIAQYSSADHANYNYNLNVAAHVLSVLGKLSLYQFKHFSPYVSVGVGQAFTTVGDYSEDPLGNVQPRVSPGYQNKSTMNTVISAGLGVDYLFNRSWSMSLGYEYLTLGKLKTGNGTSTNWTNQSLSLGSLSASAIILSVNYQLPTRF